MCIYVCTLHFITQLNKLCMRCNILKSLALIATMNTQNIRHANYDRYCLSWTLDCSKSPWVASLTQHAFPSVYKNGVTAYSAYSTVS